MPALRVLDGGRSTSETITVPRYALVETAMEAQEQTRLIDAGLAEVFGYVWAGRRTKALLALTSLQLELADARRVFRELAGIAEALPPADRPEGRAA